MTSQNMAALARGERIRLAQAQLRSEIRTLPTPQNRALVAALLEAIELDAIVGSLKVLRLLRFLPLVGEYKAYRLMRQIGVFQSAQTARVRDLTGRQRAQLAGMLRDDAERWEVAA